MNELDEIGMTKEMIDVKDEYNSTALMNAAEGGHGKIVELLLERNAMINVKGGIEDTTALMEAAGGGHGKIVELLLEKGADVDVRDSFGFQAIHYATSR